MGQANSRNQFGFVQLESAYGTVPHTGGTATVANGDAFRLISLSTDPVQPTIDRPDKTGNLSATAGVAGRKIASWRTSMSLAGSGAAGTQPDIDAFLEALFGQAGTVSAGVSVTYALADASPSLSIYNFYDPSTMVQELALGAIVQQARFDLGQDVALVEFSGQARWVLDSNQFATADATAKGGLTTFPARPSAPVTNGNFAVGFTGSVTLDGTVYSILRSANIIVGAARELPQDVFNSYYPSTPAQDVRDVRADVSIYDDDGAAFKSLRLKAINKTPVDFIIQIGAVAGNIWTFTLKNVLVSVPVRDDGQRQLAVTLSGCRAHATSATSKDEITLVCT